MSKYLVIGSGPGAVGWVTEHRRFFRRAVVCPINNAWKAVGIEDIDIWYHSMDFFHAGHVFPDPRVMPRLMPKAKTRFRNYPYNYNVEGTRGTMLMCTLMDILNSARDPSEITVGVACCDMVYKPEGDTHFYGKGAPDPLRFGEDQIVTWVERTKAAYEAAGAALLNVGPIVHGSRFTAKRATVYEMFSEHPMRKVVYVCPMCRCMTVVVDHMGLDTPDFIMCDAPDDHACHRTLAHKSRQPFPPNIVATHESFLPTAEEIDDLPLDDPTMEFVCNGGGLVRRKS